MRALLLRASKVSMVVVWGLCLCVLAGCRSETGEPGASDAAAASTTKLEVYVTNYPLEYLTKTIAGDSVNVHFPVPADVDPENWKPTAEDIEKLQKADLIVINGAGYEKWLEHHSLPESKIVNTTEYAKKRYIKLPDAVVHKHGPEGEHAHEGIASYTWLDPQIMDMQSYAIREALIERRPNSRSLFESGAGTISQSFIVALVLPLRNLETKFPELKIIGSHPVYDYLARYLKWPLKSVHWEPSETPSEEEWEKFAALHAEHPASLMLWEAEPTAETRKRLEEEFQIKVVVFNTLAQRPASGNYQGAMQENIARLQAALGVEAGPAQAAPMPGGPLPTPGAAP